jgi:hypothetical protein
MPERVVNRVSHPDQWVWWLLHPRLPLAADAPLRCLVTVAPTIHVPETEPDAVLPPLGWYEEASGWGEEDLPWNAPENWNAHAIGPFDSPYSAVAAIAWLNIGETPRGVSIVAQGVNNTGRFLSDRELLYAGDAAFRAHDLVWTCWDMAQMVMLQTGLWLHWGPSEHVCDLFAEWVVQDPPKYVTIARRKPDPACLSEEKWRPLR